MKVLEVISNLYPTGGGETFAVNLSRELSSMCELKVVVLYSKYKQYFIDRLKEKGIEPIVLNKQKHFDLKNAKELRKIINDFKPDVIHTENNALIPTYLALRKTKYKKTINVFHTMHLEPKDECPKKILYMLFKHILRKKNYVPVAITKQLSAISSSYYKVENVPFINNGSDLEPFVNKIELNKRNYDIVVVGRFSEQKNHKFLIPAFAELKKLVPSLKVALVGGGELFDEIKELAKQHNVLDFVDFKGLMNSPAEVVNDSKIILLGSLFEANPLSLLEGMSSGCIVVSTNVGGVSDIIKEGENGFLFEVNDQNKFLSITSNILNNINSYRNMSKHNTEYSKNFSMNKCAKDYIELFNRY
ncbi:MAG: glycosyltransferase [Bacilli bacterium]|nr:glycosyltransferase [Bacilli bacterium]